MSNPAVIENGKVPAFIAKEVAGLEKHNDNQLVPVNENQSFMEMMERLAMSNIDVVKLEKMMDLHERMLNRNAEQAFASDYVRMKPHLPKILRTKKNTQTDSKYAPLEDINTQVDPILEQYHFGTSTKVVAQTETSVTVEAILWHRDGHKETCQINMPLDDKGAKGTVNKTLPHATSSSVTYAKRVAICALLNISTGDDSDGNKQSDIVSNEQAVEIDMLITKVKADKKAFLAFFKTDDVRNLRSDQYVNAIAMLEAKGKKA